jgi:ankyrin repeat protein
VVKALLARGAHITRSSSGTPLHVAAKNGHAGCVVLLLKRGPHVHAAKTDDGRLAIHVAAQCGRDAVVEILLQNGARDVNAKATNGLTPLHAAVGEGHGSTVQLLLRNGAEVNATTAQGDTPLHVAVSKKYTAVLHLLLQNGADPSAISNNGDAPLHAATRAGRLTDGVDAAMTVQTLLENGADIDARGDDRSTALDIAVKFRVDAVVKTLLQRGADPNATTHANWDSLLHTATLQSDLVLMRTLLEHGAAVDAQGFAGLTPLHLAASIGSGAMVELLLEKGADISALSAAGTTPLDVARYDNEDVLAALLEPMRRVQCAFAMGHHPRLGAASIVQTLDLEVVRMVLDLV